MRAPAIPLRWQLPMRLPLPFLLYVTALALFGWVGWTVYELLPLMKSDARNAASTQGIDDGRAKIGEGKGKGPAIVDWNYGKPNWWPQLKQVNLIGKLPPKKPTPEEIEQAKQPVEPVVDMTPLDEIFELVSLVYDGKGGGKGENSHVIIRYKQGVDVQPPAWWERENAPPSTSGGSGVARVRDAVRPGRLGRPGPTPGKRAGSKLPATTARPGRPGRPGRPMPSTSTAGREILQKLWVDDGGNIRRSSQLWETFDHIRLVRVAPDAQSAFFVREMPPKDDGGPAETKEEEILKTTMNLSQDVLKELRLLQGREGERTGRVGRPVASGGAAQPWREVEETTRFGNQFNIGRKDERRFRENADDFFSNVYADTYVSKVSDRRGVQVRSIKPQIAQRFGVVTGDVLLEINGRKVESKAQAVNRVKKDYKRGVRTFSTKWLTADGQIADRVYQAPDR